MIITIVIDFMIAIFKLKAITNERLDDNKHLAVDARVSKNRTLEEKSQMKGSKGWKLAKKSIRIVMYCIRHSLAYSHCRTCKTVNVTIEKI